MDFLHPCFLHPPGAGAGWWVGGRSWFWGESIHLHFVGVNGYSSLLNFSLCLSPGPFSVCLWLFVYLLLWVLWTLKNKHTLLQNFQKDVYCNEIYFPDIIIIIINNKHYEKMVRHKDFQAVLLNDLFQCYMSRPFTCCNNVFIFDIVIFYLHIIFAFYQLNLNFHLISFSVFYHVTQSGQRWKNY